MVSIIIAAFNASKYVSETIESVLRQEYNNWELIVVDNNSNDNTLQIVKSFEDKRIIVISEYKQGVGHARNAGLKIMKGSFFCFLDADDVMPTTALSSRLQIFESNPNLDFVDGGVQYVDEVLVPMNKKYTPSFIGMPFDRLLKLDSSCLFGNTWMIKKDPNENYTFQTDMTHAEDLFFYLSISRGKQYSFTSDTVLFYRQRQGSAMSNISGLENGYIKLIKKIKNRLNTPFKTVLLLKLKIAKIMFLSFLFHDRNFVAAIKSPIRILKA